MKPLLLAFTFFFLFTTQLALAQNTVDIGQDRITADGFIDGKFGFIPCNGPDCSTCHIVALVNTLVKWLIGMVFLFFAVIAVYAGFEMVTSGGNSGALSDAKSKFTNAFIGLIIVLAAWLMVDTLLKGLLIGGDGVLQNTQANVTYGPWSKIQCVGQYVPTIIPGVPAVTTPSGGGGTPGGSAGGSGGGGSQCSILTNGPCSPQNLQQYFGARAEEASRVCHLESGGNAGLRSRTDLCSDGDSFSVGLFQINIIAHADRIPGCVKSELVENLNLSNGGIGACAVPLVTNRNGVSYCPRRQCAFKNPTMYSTCVRGAIANNLSIASQLYGPGGFRPWQTSANHCNVPL